MFFLILSIARAVCSVVRDENWPPEILLIKLMESTGSDWIPVFNLLEGHVRVVLANPEEVKNRNWPSW